MVQIQFWKFLFNKVLPNFSLELKHVYFFIFYFFFDVMLNASLNLANSLIEIVVHLLFYYVACEKQEKNIKIWTLVISELYETVEYK